jgi:hypothetical protein
MDSAPLKIICRKPAELGPELRPSAPDAGRWHPLGVHRSIELPLNST